MVVISELDAGRREEASSDGDLPLWPRPMRKGAGDMPGIASVCRAGRWSGDVHNGERTRSRGWQERRAINKEQRRKRSSRLVIDSEAQVKAAGNTRHLTAAGEDEIYVYKCKCKK